MNCQVPATSSRAIRSAAPEETTTPTSSQTSAVTLLGAFQESLSRERSQEWDGVGTFHELSVLTRAHIQYMVSRTAVQQTLASVLDEVLEDTFEFGAMDDLPLDNRP